MNKILCMFLLAISPQVFAAFCFTNNQNVNSCNPQQIQSSLASGNAVVLEMSGNILKQTVIFPMSADVPNKIITTEFNFKKTASTYEKISSEGCITTGGFRETADTVTFTPKKISGTCPSGYVRLFELIKNDPDVMKKINY